MEKTETMMDIETPVVPGVEPVAMQGSPWFVVLTALWWNRRILAGFLIAGVIVSTAIAFLIPNYYKSTVQLMPPGWQSSGNRIASSISAIPMLDSGGGGLTGGANLAGLLNSHDVAGPLLGIIASRTMLDSLINRFNLQGVYHTRYLVDARKILSRRTDANEDKPTGIISIVVTDRDPARARDLAAAYVEELNKLVVEMDTSAAHRERLFLEQRLKDVESELETSEEQFGHYSSRTGTMDQNSQSKAMLDAFANVQGELIAAQSDLSGLQSLYSPESARVVQAKARVAALSEQLQKLEGARGGEADMSLEYPSMRQLPLLGVTYADLYRRTKTLEVADELLSRELESAKIEEAEGIPSVKVLDPPVIAQKKSFPPRIPIILGGVLLSFLMWIGWIVIQEEWQRRKDSDSWKRFAFEIASSLNGIGRSK
jgi:capsule polysaccharide export protein KpsE/RkpR